MCDQRGEEEKWEASNTEQLALLSPAGQSPVIYPGLLEEVAPCLTVTMREGGQLLLCNVVQYGPALRRRLDEVTEGRARPLQGVIDVDLTNCPMAQLAGQDSLSVLIVSAEEWRQAPAVRNAEYPSQLVAAQGQLNQLVQRVRMRKADEEERGL